MLGLGAHYKPSEPYDFVVPCDVVQKQIVAVEFCKAIRSNQKIEIAVCSKHLDFHFVAVAFFMLNEIALIDTNGH